MRSCRHASVEFEGQQLSEDVAFVKCHDCDKYTFVNLDTYDSKGGGLYHLNTKRERRREEYE